MRREEDRPFLLFYRKTGSAVLRLRAEEWDELAKTVETEAGNIANAMKKEDNVEKEDKGNAGKDESENR